MESARDSRLRELVFMDHGPLPLRAAVLVVAASGTGFAGVALLRLHQSLAARLAAHMALNPLQTLLATGSSLRTLWPGWVAAACFAFALLRLRTGASEPAPGRTPVDELTPAQLRRGLRSEYRLVRCALVVVGLIAAVDAARLGAALLGLAGGDHELAAAMPATVAEAAGYVAATTALATWAFTFGTEVRRLGAL